MASFFEKSKPDSETTGTFLEGMSYEEIALDWISRAASIRRLDTSWRVISPEGYGAIQEVRSLHELQLRSAPEEYEHAELQGQEELVAAEAEVTGRDEGVLEKTKFLAFLAEQIDPSHTIERLRLDEGEKHEATVLADIESTPLRDVLVGLRKYAERVAGRDAAQDLLIEFQFEGLWAIYQAGKLAIETK
jgi:hypothetical protein